MKARYNRVSTANQSLERQLAKQNPDEVLYNDIVSGSVAFNERLKGKELLNDILAKKVNYVSVSSIDRLGRNLMDILETLELCNNNGVTIKVDNLGIESMVDGKINQVFKLIISVLGNVAEMERDNILERQREGIAIAKAKGVYKGRERGSVESDEDVLLKYKGVVKLLKEGYSIRKTAKLEDVSHGTVQKVRKILNK
ncbi:transposase [Tenacibaculum maritimum]|uniref:recombinase family protein n=1 Tax=Tenacibaculum maritimum TaxID=107401 RepID=UPI0012E5DBD1|nr:recombinase family protein [Tenacibaculum maritimum]CAA0229316.1 transposase [Tenacibaculum maritimum]